MSWLQTSAIEACLEVLGGMPVRRQQAVVHYLFPQFNNSVLQLILDTAPFRSIIFPLFKSILMV